MLRLSPGGGIATFALPVSESDRRMDFGTSVVHASTGALVLYVPTPVLQNPFSSVLIFLQRAFFRGSHSLASSFRKLV